MDQDELVNLVQILFPINRSLTGKGNRKSLEILKRVEPSLNILEIRSGTKVFDWVIPDEWNVLDAYIECPDGRRFAQFTENNLHLVGYSEPIDKLVSRSELLQHLHSVPSIPNAIPYVTSYYKRTWGFCLSHEQLDELGDGPFHVLIDSSFKSASDGGSLTMGEIFIKGETNQEVVFSTYICHPSMANNELSGPVVAVALARFLSEKKRHFSYRILFLPETIGAITFLNNNLAHLRDNCIAGWVLTCLGDSGQFSYVPSRDGTNLADQISIKILSEQIEGFRTYSWLDRGSDERQFCAPGVDLPFCSITRSKYGTFPEYHTSLDNLDFISASSLVGSVDLFKRIINALEHIRVPKIRTLGEPQLGKRNLYPNLNRFDTFTSDIQNLSNVISFCDGSKTFDQIADKCKISIDQVSAIIDTLHKEGLVDY